MADRSERVSGSEARTGEPLLWFNGGGHEFRTGPDYYHDARTRRDQPHVVLQLTLGGTGLYRRFDGGGRRLLGPGQAWLDQIPGPFEYGYAGEGGEGTYEQVFVSMVGDVARAWMERVHAAHGPVLDFGDHATTGASVADTMFAIIGSRVGPGVAGGGGRDRYLMSGQLYGLYMQVMSVLSRSRLAATPLAARAIEAIERAAPDAGFNVTRLARALDCSREHLAREFGRATGVSPLEYLTQTRVRLAARELRGAGEGTAPKLATVARRAGFSSPAYLCRVFRRVVGVTPDRFRKRPWLVVP